jgi:hypothetical protein
MPAPPPSSRLLRAAAAERVEIARHRARMVEEAEELRRALARVERGLIELDERRALLDRLAPPEEMEGAAGDRRGEGAGGDARGAGAGGGDVRGIAAPGQELLRGPEIREVAVRVLVESGEEALHYRDWFALLLDRGLAIAGKDPLAVFLTQLSRSPAVRRAAAAGTYELDRHAAVRHRTRLEALQRDLRELTVTPATDLNEIRRRREALNADIGRVEKALEEIARVLGPAPPLHAIATTP